MLTALIRKQARHLTVATVCAALLVSPLYAATTEEQAVLAPINGLFDAMASHDKEAARAQLLPGGMITLKRNDQILQLHFDSFVDHLGGTDRIEERIHDPLVHIDDDIAVVWVPYEFLVDGKIHHCGTDIANLVYRNGRWLISGLADNSHENCKK